MKVGHCSLWLNKIDIRNTTKCELVYLLTEIVPLWTGIPLNRNSSITTLFKSSCNWLDIRSYFTLLKSYTGMLYAVVTVLNAVLKTKIPSGNDLECRGYVTFVTALSYYWNVKSYKQDIKLTVWKSVFLVYDCPKGLTWQEKITCGREHTHICSKKLRDIC
jgi:hypothetical protein